MDLILFFFFFFFITLQFSAQTLRATVKYRVLFLKHLYFSYLGLRTQKVWGRRKGIRIRAEIYNTRQNENVQLTDTGRLSLSLQLLLVAKRKWMTFFFLFKYSNYKSLQNKFQALFKFLKYWLKLNVLGSNPGGISAKVYALFNVDQKSL